MKSLTILDVLDRAHNGPICTLKDWDSRFLPAKIAEVLQRHRLIKTCNPQEPVNTDDSLADEFYRAGYELALETGILCLDTERIIKVGQDELNRSIKEAPSELRMGRGHEEVTLRARKPEDAVPPLFAAPLGIEISEELWVPLMQGIVESRYVDVFIGGSIPTVFGRTVVSGTPYETLVGWLETKLRGEVLWRSGRPGMPTEAVISATTAYGQLGGFDLPGVNTDIALVLCPFELKTSYMALHKVIHALSYGGIIRSGTPTMIGGYVGPPEGAVVANIAVTLLQYPVHLCKYSGGTIFDIRYSGNCARDGQWALGMATQALSRNTHLLIDKIVEPVAGPCTEMLLYETAVGAINVCASGVSITDGARSTGGKYANYLTPLECWFEGEVLKAAAGMTRRQANEFLNALIPRYEDKLLDPPKGKSVTECFDLREKRPSKEWMDIYLRVKGELREMGLPLVD